MKTLFELSQEILALNDILEDCEGDPSRLGEAESHVMSWLDGVESQLTEKLANYANLIHQLEMEEAAAKAEAEQWAKKAESRSKRAKWLKERLKKFMEATKQTKLMTADGQTIRIQNNGGLRALSLAEGVKPRDFPTAFQEITIVVNMEKLREHLEKAAGNRFPESEEATALAWLKPRGCHVQIRK